MGSEKLPVEQLSRAYPIRPTGVGSETIMICPISCGVIRPTGVGLRVAMSPRAEKSAPTQWGAWVLGEIVRAPQAWGTPCIAWLGAAGGSATSHLRQWNIANNIGRVFLPEDRTPPVAPCNDVGGLYSLYEPNKRSVFQAAHKVKSAGRQK